MKFDKDKKEKICPICLEKESECVCDIVDEEEIEMNDGSDD